MINIENKNGKLVFSVKISVKYEKLIF